MTGTGSPKQSKPFTGRRMAAYLVGGFGVIVTANLTLAGFAVTSWTGLTARNGYVASQDFNKVLAKARRQAARGWKAQLRTTPSGLLFEINDPTGAPVTGLALRVRLGRPVHERDDFEVPLVAVPGGYTAAAQLAPGAWRARVFSVDDKVAYRSQFRLRIAAPGG